MNKFILNLIILLFLINLSFASYTYSNYNWYSYSDTLSHGESKNIQYVVKNTNSVCRMSCSAKAVSNLKDSNSINFNLDAGDSEVLSFTIYAPSKKESGYKSSGSIDYNLDIECYDESSFLCDGSKQDGDDLGQTEFKVIYELSQNDENNKENLDEVLSPLKNNIQEFNDKLYELKSMYNNAKKQILIKNINSQINSLESKYKSLKSNADSISDDYEKLDFYSAIQTYNSMTSYPHSSVISQIENLEKDIEDARKDHNNAVSDLKLIKAQLNKLNDESYLFKLDLEYKNLISSYELILNDLENLAFSSYVSLDSEIETLNLDINNFENKINTQRVEIINQLKENYVLSYSKINEEKIILEDSTKEVINTYCNDFKTILPQKFNSFNQLKEKEYVELNEKRINRNIELDSFSSKWEELGLIIFQINNLSKNNYHDSILNSCIDNINSLNSSEISLFSIENTIDSCLDFRSNLEANIEKNNGFFSTISNFFKSFFSDNNKIEINNLKELDSFKNNVEYIFEPVSFSEESKSLTEKYCDINIEKVYLDSTSSIDNIEKNIYTGGDIVDFKTESSECENNKCYSIREGFPILFVHGHLFNANSDPLKESINTFDELIRYISKEEDNFYDAGKIVSAGSSNLGSSAEKTSEAAMYRTTYYGGAINSNGDFYWSESKYDSISDYADKLKEIIDSTLDLTNRKQVKIVSHSMGGLVVREYIRKYGDSKIDTFIMIATPNKGVVGDIADNCIKILGIIEKGAETECNEMTKGSSFLSTLNSMSRSELPERTYIFSGVYSNSDTDGIVTYENTKISGVENFKKTSSESYEGSFLEGFIGGELFDEDFLHSQLLDPNIASITSDEVIDLLK